MLNGQRLSFYFLFDHAPKLFNDKVKNTNQKLS